MKAWLWFAFVQLVSLAATMIGWVLLIPFCLREAWIQTASTEPGRQIDRWALGPFNFVYGNREDGVSGRYALIWNSTGRVPYMPNAWAPWRAYLWSGWRNSADNLKYVFRWDHGPFVRREFRSWYVQAGWNSGGAPVLSAGRK